MGVNIESIKTKSCCYKVCICDHYLDKYQKLYTPKYNINNNINNLNTFEIKDKINSLSPENFEELNKNKLKKIFLDKHVSSITNSSKSDLSTMKTIQLQSYIRGYLLRKKVLQLIINTKSAIL